MMSEDNKTVATSDFLDLIQEEAITAPSSSTTRKYSSDTKARYTLTDKWSSDRSRESSLFRVRLTQTPESKVRTDLEQDEVHHIEEDRKYRQKMPLNGGYGGMFEASGPLKKHAKKIKGPYGHGDDATHTSDVSNRSSMSTAFSLASKWISSKFSTQGKMMWSTNPPIPSRIKRNKRPPSELFASLPEWCIQLSIRWLRVPFQCRYFLQLFSIAAVFLLSSLNYFIEVDDGRPHSVESSIMSGGGASTNRIPTMHIKRPFQYLHSDKHENALLEKAKSKLKQSTRIGSDASVFEYGWKSMPRQIFLDRDGDTIEIDNNLKEVLDIKVFPPKGTVAYVLPVTTCYNPSDDMQDLYPDAPNQPVDEESFRDFAIMLRAMLHAHSYQNPASGSMYDYKMHALIHPSAKMCTDESGTTADRSQVLVDLGYQVSVVRPPLNPDNIEGSEILRKQYTEQGGENMNNLSDLIRLNAYELDEYDAVVLVDYDTLILGAVDEAIDLINDNTKSEIESVNAVFSWKHIRSFGRHQYRASVVNLSFFVLRPSKEIYTKLRRAIKEAAFSESRGWGKIGRGRFPGWMTTQGFLTYYYDEVDNAGRVEENRCTFGNTGLPTTRSSKDLESMPIGLITNAGKVDCEIKQSQWTNQCQDCSEFDLQDVLVADMSYCIAPWKCGVREKSSTTSSSDTLSSPLCRKFQKTWFSARLQMEDVHPQLQKSSGSICVGTEYQPMRVAD
jgi:hypothetical protein